MPDLKSLGQEFLLPLLAQLTDVTNRQMCEAIDAIDYDSRKEAADLYLGATQALGFIAAKLNATRGALLGPVPDHDALMSLLHAIDARKLNTDALDLLTDDLTRLFERFGVLPRELRDAMWQRLDEHERAIAERHEKDRGDERPSSKSTRH